MRWDPFPLTAGVLCRPRPSLGGFHSDSMLSLTAVDLQLNLSIMKWAVWCCEKVLAPSWFHSVGYVCDTVHFYLFRQNDCSLELLSRPFQITAIFSPQLSSFKIKKWIKIQTTGVDNHLRISTNFDYTFLKLSFFFSPAVLLWTSLRVLDPCLPAWPTKLPLQFHLRLVDGRSDVAVFNLFWHGTEFIVPPVPPTPSSHLARRDILAIDV